MKVLMGFTLAFCLGAASAAAAAPSKVTICHRVSPTKTQQMSVASSAVAEHRAHGDFIGACNQDCRLAASVCNDNNACTNDSCNSTNGTCTHTAVTCNDQNACTVDTCSAATGCAYTARNCDDGSLCTIDSCDSVDGCEYHDVDCRDSSVCTQDSCNPASGCSHVPVTCDDKNACTDDSCDDTDGCVFAPSLCDDENLCTDDTCDDVTGCVNDPVVCETAGEVCHRPTGECIVPPPPCGNCAWESNGDGCENAACSAAVCALDEICCNNWDEICAAFALNICVNADTPLCSVKCGDCMAQPHGPGCEWPACERLVCTNEPDCCTEAWTGDCTHQAQTSNGCEKNSATLCTPN